MLDNTLVEKIEECLCDSRGIKFIATDKQETEMDYNADKKVLLVKLAKKDCKVDSQLKFKHRLEFIDMADPRINLTELRKISAPRIGLLNIQGHRLHSELTFSLHSILDELNIQNCEFLGKEWRGPFNFIAKINFKNFKATNLKSARHLFDGYSGETVDISWLKDNQLEDMGYMFLNCTKLKEIKGLDKLNTSKCTTIEGMFDGCNDIKQIDLSGLDLSNVENAQNLIYNCNYLKEINLGNLNLNKRLTLTEFGSFKSITFCNYCLEKIIDTVPVELNEDNMIQILDWCTERDQIELEFPKINSIKLTKRIVGYLSDYFGFSRELHIVEDTDNIIVKAEMFNDFIEDFGFFKALGASDDDCYLAFKKIEVDKEVRKELEKYL